MNKTILLGFLVVAIIGLSCENKKEFKKSDFGFEYKFLKEGNGTVAKDNDFIAFDIEYYNDEKLLMQSAANRKAMPYLIQMGPQIVNDSTPINMAIKMLKEGDSAVFKFNAKSLFDESFQQPLPDTIAEESSIIVCAILKDVIPADSINAYMENMERKTHIAQLKELEGYFTEQGLEVTTTESGLSYIVLEEGEGESPVMGDSVSVHYTGMLMDGTVFDSSVDKGEPIKFPLGVGYVIRGWDEGIALLSKNAKAKFFVPSSLGYGSRGAGRIIPPNSILIFEVELVDF